MNNQPELTTYLNLCSEYYDLDKPEAPIEELAFYRDYMKDANGPILEPMCGTGRFLIPFFNEGFDVEGFDASSFMLARLKYKCGSSQPIVWQAFFEDLILSKKYKLIFIPSGSFGLITELKKAIACLNLIYQHLLADGVFVFEIETLSSVPSNLNNWQGSVCCYPDGKFIILSSLSLPPKENVGTMICKYELIEENHILKTEIEDVKVRLYSTDELYTILKQVGFRQIKFIKAFKKNEEPDKTDQIVLVECKK